MGYRYRKTPYRYVANYKHGKWEKGALVEDDTIVISECAGVLQYSQSVFEGLKAYTQKNGDIVTFRPNKQTHHNIFKLYFDSEKIK